MATEQATLKYPERIPGKNITEDDKMIVNHNVSALEALTNLSNTDTKMQSSLEKLSSGLKITKSSDDAAGLAISEQMRSQINALGQAKSNAQDGVSLLQTAEGALNTTTDVLQRLNTLAVRAANDATLTTSDKGLIQSEADQLTSELTRMSSTVQFNTKSLLDGSFTGETLQVGTSSKTSDQLTISITGVDATTLGINSLDFVNSATGAIDSITSAITTVSTNRGAIGAVMNRLEETNSNIDIETTNMTASESRIRDVDMASEMSNYTKLQVMEQAGTAMLAQANSLPNNVLSLLK
jgi:flagellin